MTSPESRGPEISGATQVGQSYALSIETHDAPPAVSAEYAPMLQRTKADVLAASADGVVQAAGAVLPQVTIPWPEAHEVGLGSIDMFTMAPDGSVAPAGVDAEIAEKWMPAVSTLATAVATAIDNLGVTLAGDAYITASANEACDVSHEPHFDDDMFVAGDGVGLVAIVGQHGGPRLASGLLPMSASPAGSPTQLPLDAELQQRFDDGEVPAQHADADRIVLFPGFMQLHSGPKLPEGTDPRLLLVLRAETIPTV